MPFLSFLLLSHAVSFHAELKQSREQAALPSLSISTAAEALRAQLLSLTGAGGPCSVAGPMCSCVPLASQLAAQTQ